MTRDEIIEMARQVGLWPAVTDTFPKELEAFAKLVAEKEREACAKVCDDLDKMRGYSYADKCATAIRARGQA